MVGEVRPAKCWIWSLCNRNRPISQITQYAHFCYKMVHCVIWDWCIVGFVQQVYYEIIVSIWHNPTGSPGWRIAGRGIWTATPLQRCTWQWHRLSITSTVSTALPPGFDTNSHLANMPQKVSQLPCPGPSSEAWVSTSRDRSQSVLGSVERFCTQRRNWSCANASVVTKIGTDCRWTSLNVSAVHVDGTSSRNADRSNARCHDTAFGDAKCKKYKPLQYYLHMEIFLSTSVRHTASMLYIRRTDLSQPSFYITNTFR